jgi:hypothetical protein
MTIGIWGLRCIAAESCRDPSKGRSPFLMHTGGGAFVLHHRLMACKPPACSCRLHWKVKDLPRHQAAKRLLLRDQS